MTFSISSRAIKTLRNSPNILSSGALKVHFGSVKNKSKVSKRNRSNRAMKMTTTKAIANIFEAMFSTRLIKFRKDSSRRFSAINLLKFTSLLFAFITFTKIRLQSIETKDLKTLTGVSSQFIKVWSRFHELA